jgi:hypothetical protein
VLAQRFAAIMMWPVDVSGATRRDRSADVVPGSSRGTRPAVDGERAIQRQNPRMNPMAAKKTSGRKYSKGAGKKVAKAMSERKKGTLTSGRSGKKVKSKKQAVAIGLSPARARKAGKKVPAKKKSTSRSKSRSTKRS